LHRGLLLDGLLLDRMGQLMRDQLAAGAGIGAEGAAREKDVIAAGEGPRTQSHAEPRRPFVGVDAHWAEIRVKALLHLVADRFRQRGAATLGRL
jgi:hypothetical protein